jgi:hypothetical protein
LPATPEQKAEHKSIMDGLGTWTSQHLIVKTVLRGFETINGSGPCHQLVFFSSFPSLQDARTLLSTLQIKFASPADIVSTVKLCSLFNIVTTEQFGIRPVVDKDNVAAQTRVDRRAAHRLKKLARNLQESQRRPPITTVAMPHKQLFAMYSPSDLPNYGLHPAALTLEEKEESLLWLFDVGYNNNDDVMKTNIWFCESRKDKAFAVGARPMASSLQMMCDLAQVQPGIIKTILKQDMPADDSFLEPANLAKAPEMAKNILKLQRDRCTNCALLKKEPINKGLYACGGCQLTRYCSKACQKEDWKKHKPMLNLPSTVEGILAQQGSL